MLNSCDAKEEKDKKGLDAKIEEQFLKERKIFLWGGVDDDSAEIIVKKLLYLDSLNNDDITLVVNSPGGVISSGLAILDVMNSIKSDVSTYCMGQAASMGAVLLCAGAKGKRYISPSSRVMIHQPLISGNMTGSASDLEIQSEEMERIRENLNKVLADASGKKLSQIEKDTDRDNFLSAEESVAYGLADSVK